MDISLTEEEQKLLLNLPKVNIINTYNGRTSRRAINQNMKFY